MTEEYTQVQVTAKEWNEQNKQKDWNLEEIEAEIEECKEKREYRPQGLYVVYKTREDGEPLYLITRPRLVNKKTGELRTDIDTSNLWALLQGGIDDEQTIAQSLDNEGLEELGIKQGELSIQQIGLPSPRRIDEPNPEKLRPPYTKGKAYFSAKVEYLGNGAFTYENVINPGTSDEKIVHEVLEAGFYTFEETVSRLANEASPNSLEKTTLALAALFKAHESFGRGLSGLNLEEEIRKYEANHPKR